MRRGIRRRNEFVFITNEGNPNQDWNTVWEVRTSRFDGGWSLEMRVPLQVSAVSARRAAGVGIWMSIILPRGFV